MTPTPEAPPRPLEFELRFRRQAYTCPKGTVISGATPVDTFVRTPEKDKDLLDAPAGFDPAHPIL